MFFVTNYGCDFMSSKRRVGNSKEVKDRKDGKKTPNPEAGAPLVESLREKLDEFDRTSIEYEKRMVDLYWRLFHGEALEPEIEKLEAENREFVSSFGYASLLKENLQNASDLDKRELEVRYASLMVNNVKGHPEVVPVMHAAGRAQYDFRVTVDGEELSEGDVAKTLATCEDPERREQVWLAQEQSLALAQHKLEVAKTLNKATLSTEGRETYAHLVLETQDATTDNLRSMIENFENRTSQIFQSFVEQLKSFFGISKILPHDLNFYVRKYLSGIKGDVLPKSGSHALEMLKSTLGAMGFSDVHGSAFLDVKAIDKEPFTFDIDGGPNHLPEECAIRIGPGIKDYRVFINPKLSPTGIDFTRTVLLEGGRVVHYYALDELKTRDAFKWDSDCMRHALAMLFDSILEDEKWLRDIAGLETSEAQTLSKMLKMKKLSMARKLAADALFEIKLYLGEEPGTAFREVAEMFAGSKIEYEVEKRWAWHPHLAYNPAGQLSYILGYLTYEIIADDMMSRFGTLVHPKAAEYLVDNLYTGYEVPWPERLKKITGRSLD